MVKERNTQFEKRISYVKAVTSYNRNGFFYLGIKMQSSFLTNYPSPQTYLRLLADARFTAIGIHNELSSSITPNCCPSGRLFPLQQAIMINKITYHSAVEARAYSHYNDVHIASRSSIITNAFECEILPELFAYRYLIIVYCLS